MCKILYQSFLEPFYWISKTLTVNNWFEQRKNNRCMKKYVRLFTYLLLVTWLFFFSFIFMFIIIYLYESISRLIIIMKGVGSDQYVYYNYYYY